MVNLKGKRLKYDQRVWFRSNIPCSQKKWARIRQLSLPSVIVNNVTRTSAAALLLPFSWIYGAGVWLRNKMFDLEIKKSVEYQLPVISIGNLSTGGTGKTPHIEYLLTLLEGRYKAGVLSRGYKRKTTGYLLLDKDTDSRTAGDEPVQIKKNFPEATIAVCEERALGIPIMLLDDPQLEVILLDDAFQHRNVKPSLSILLTEYDHLFTRDALLPAGKLREPSRNAARADVIIVTKCPIEISQNEKLSLEPELKQHPGQRVFFSFIEHQQPNLLSYEGIKPALNKYQAALVVTGIANARPLLCHIESHIKNVIHCEYSDHHYFSVGQIARIIKEYEALPAPKIFITTEKDGVRLLNHYQLFKDHDIEIYCIPVKVYFSDDERAEFDSFILEIIEKKIHDDGFKDA